MIRISALLFIGLSAGAMFSSCKKKEATPTPIVVAPPVVTTCIEDAFNGDYLGTFTYPGTSPSTLTINVVKTSCTTCTINAPSPYPQVLVTGITASSGGGYAGTAGGQPISLALSNGNVTLSIGGSFTFVGDRQ